MGKNEKKECLKFLGVHTPIRMIAMKNPKTGADRAGYVAVALETNIWGFGESLDEAMSNLENLSKMQIEYAVNAKCPDMLDVPTKERWFILWDNIQKESVHGSKKKKKEEDFSWAELRRSVSVSEAYAPVAA